MPNIFGTLENNDNFLAFVECFSQTNFFKLLDINKKDLYFGPRNYIRFLEYIMNLNTEKNNKQYWLQKSSTLKLEELYEKFPDAKFLIIERNPKDNIMSTIGLKMKKLLKKEDSYKNLNKNIVKEIFLYLIEKKRAKPYKKKKNVKLVKFENFKNNKKSTVRDIFEFLDIDFSKELLKDKYKKNTSFNGNISKNNILGRFDILVIKILYPLMKILPLYILEKIFHIKNKFSNNFNEGKFIAKTFELRKKDLKNEGINLE
ncbi:MAG: sulfotransferase domain-containing protein [archaeon]